MAVLFAGTELEAFRAFQVGSIVKSTAFNDTNYSNGDLRLGLTAEIQAPFANTTQGYCHFRFTRNNATTSQQDQDFFWLTSSADQIAFKFDQTNGINTMQYWDGSAFQSFGTTWTPGNGTTHTIDVAWNIADSGGYYRVYVDGSLHAETGSIDTNVTDVANIAKAHFSTSARGTDTSIGYSYIGEVIVADESTIDWRVQTLLATAAGTTSGFTGAYTDIVDDVTYDDTDQMFSDAALEKSTFTTGNMSVAAKAVGEIKAVAVCSRARYTGAGPTDLDHVVRVSATDYNGAAVGLEVGYEPAITVWDTSPATAVAWTDTEVDAMEFGFESQT